MNGFESKAIMWILILQMVRPDFKFYKKSTMSHAAFQVLVGGFKLEIRQESLSGSWGEAGEAKVEQGQVEMNMRRERVTELEDW